MTSHERLPSSEITHLVARDGVAAHADALTALGARAVALGVTPGAASVLLDPAAPAVARERAYAVVARALVRRRRPSAHDRDQGFAVVA
ncbi:MAG: hypothetical protein KDB35_08395 [Acidimicrobiales bacterium]|nr:hypothetical protein [Acidimicrobiales bacterium]MCB1017572.1 hypothetical protein [Acidimicrobiales bacterium]